MLSTSAIASLDNSPAVSVKGSDMGDDRDAMIAELRRDLAARGETIEALQRLSRADRQTIEVLRKERSDQDEELRSYRESYNRASTALSAAGVPHIVPNGGTDDDERLAERIRYLASLHPLFVWPADPAMPAQLARTRHLLSDHRHAIEALARMAAGRVDLNARQSRELVLRLARAELDRIEMHTLGRIRTLTASAGAVLGVDPAMPGSERTVEIVHVCGCGECPTGKLCPNGYTAARDIPRR